MPPLEQLFHFLYSDERGEAIAIFRCPEIARRADIFSASGPPSLRADSGNACEEGSRLARGLLSLFPPPISPVFAVDNCVV